MAVDDKNKDIIIANDWNETKFYENLDTNIDKTPQHSYTLSPPQQVSSKLINNSKYDKKENDYNI